ncbi:MAG: hypothetical protein BWY94_02291 [Actinobacteria bacterium ADurb.BinA094]|nr:MAG: hypothetical protein BWY94_02291 [Actinobacteria bacterium ADurb.BinA094]
MKLEKAPWTPALNEAALRAGALTAPSTALAIASILSVISATSWVIWSTLPRLAFTPSSVVPAFCMSGTACLSTSSSTASTRPRVAPALNSAYAAATATSTKKNAAA